MTEAKSFEADLAHASDETLASDESGVAARCFGRRTVLVGACGLGLAATLAACSTYGGSSDSGGDSSSGDASKPAAAAGAVLAKVSDIPSGGGKIFADEKVVVTQPVQGTFKAFSSTCTHQGCTVSDVKNGTINCPCHGSMFKIADGSVAGGPAPKPLPAVAIKVDGDSITLA